MALYRPNYFAGQLLTAEDFTAEQNYFLQKWRRHNRYLHGFGVVCGLAVTAGEGDPAPIIIEPGLALDCMGNEIEITDPVEVTLDVPITQKGCFVVVAYEEFSSEGAAVREAAFSKGQFDQNRIKEGFKIYFQEISPLISHECKPGQKSCGESHPIPIARLRRALKRWAVDHKFVVPRCK